VSAVVILLISKYSSAGCLTSASGDTVDAVSYFTMTASVTPSAEGSTDTYPGSNCALMIA
jgi:hypothetical protein